MPQFAHHRFYSAGGRTSRAICRFLEQQALTDNFQVLQQQSVSRILRNHLHAGTHGSTQCQIKLSGTIPAGSRQALSTCRCDLAMVDQAEHYLVNALRAPTLGIHVPELRIKMFSECSGVVSCGQGIRYGMLHRLFQKCYTYPGNIHVHSSLGFLRDLLDLARWAVWVRRTVVVCLVFGMWVDPCLY